MERARCIAFLALRGAVEAYTQYAAQLEEDGTTMQDWYEMSHEARAMKMKFFDELA